MELAVVVAGLLAVVLGVVLLRVRRRPPGHGGRVLRRKGNRGDVREPERFILEDGAGRHLFAEIVERTEAAFWERTDGHSPHLSSPVAVDKALLGLPAIGLALRGGKVVRILNPEALAQGRQMRSADGGLLGSIYGENSIVAQLRLSDTRNVAAIAAPLAVFQVASAVTGQHYLDHINRHLVTIEGQVARFRTEQRNATYGQITAAAEGCEELEELFASSLCLSTEDRHRLVTVETLIDTAYNQKQKDVRDLVRRVEALFAAESIRIGDVEQLLQETDVAGLYDVQLLAYAAGIRHKLNVLRAHIDLGADDGRGQLAERKVARECEQMRQDLDEAGAALSKLVVTRAEAKERWNIKGWRNPPKLLDTLHPRGEMLVAELTEAPRTLLPAPAPVPMVLEVRLDDHGVLQGRSATPPLV